MINNNEKFKKEVSQRVNSYPNKSDLNKKGKDFFIETLKEKYSYNFSWLGRPIIQYPQDIMALQEIIWKTRPEIIVETGIAHGGSIIFSASMLKMLNIDGFVIGIDIDIREHNKMEIENHFLADRIKLIEGSSIDSSIVAKVKSLIPENKKVMVILDSNHTHDHVLNELLMYQDLVTPGNYLVVFDTVVEDMADEFDWESRPWNKGNNPKTAVWEFLKENSHFEIDQHYNNKLLLSVAPDGYLKRVS